MEKPDVVPPFEVDKDGREGFVCKDKPVSRPAAIVACGDGRYGETARLAVKEQAFVGRQEDLLFESGSENPDLSGLKDRFGIAGSETMPGVELRTEDLDLHNVHIDEEGGV